MHGTKYLLGLALALSALLVSPAPRADQDAFCNGWYKGYVEGWKWASGSIFDPSIPLCPLQPRKTARDPRDDFEHGYEVGYDQGREAGGRRFR